MKTSFARLTIREDLRCGICRQKKIFVCEHDTPYRDQFLGMFNARTPRDHQIAEPNLEKKNKTNNSQTNNNVQNQGKTSNKPINNANPAKPSKQ